MKVILNKDLPTLGEEGDVKDVAKGYFRNYLFPRGIALPYNPQSIKLFEARKEEIEARKTQKRQSAMGIKERLESMELTIAMPAGPNGRLYGSVTSQTVADELAKFDFQIERKRIDLAGTGIKNAGKYKAAIKLYENSSAELQIIIIGQEIKTESKTPAKPARQRRKSPSDAENTVAENTVTENTDIENTVIENTVIEETAPPEGAVEEQPAQSFPEGNVPAEASPEASPSGEISAEGSPAGSIPQAAPSEEIPVVSADASGEETSLQSQDEPAP